MSGAATQGNGTVMASSVLVVDDEPDLLTLYELTLLREGLEVETASTVAQAREMLQARVFRAVISDMRLPDGTGLDLLQWLEASGRPEKVIVVTAYGSPENAVTALKAGAFDYLTKPVDLRQFRAVVASAMGRTRATPPPPAPESAQGPGRGDPLGRLVGASEAMNQVRGLVEKVARSMAPVLVQGESGTGKELVARAIHDVSARAGQPFVAVNCGAIPETLLEAEFFGVRKGSFTGANADRDGFFQTANGGTLFLDEIGDLPFAMQSKLLRAIQERAVRAIGATTEQTMNVRIVSATHKDLAAEVQAGRFRQDLFYRLNVIDIKVPPLRERLGDLPLIADALLARIAREAGVFPPPRLSAEAGALLARYGFPGNVRELENLLHRAVALSDGEAIRGEDLALPEALLAEAASTSRDELSLVGPQAELSLVAEGAQPAPEQPLTVAAAMGASAWQPRPPAEEAPLPDDLVRYLDEVEREILVRALERQGFNRTAAGASLGLSLRQMRYRMARLGITESEASDPL
jgi:two-component system response regulator PilR (NtrC family)